LLVTPTRHGIWRVLSFKLQASRRVCSIQFGHECSIEIQSFVRVYPALIVHPSYVLLAAISGCATWRQYSKSHCNSDMKRKLSIWAGNPRGHSVAAAFLFRLAES